MGIVSQARTIILIYRITTTVGPHAAISQLQMPSLANGQVLLALATSPWMGGGYAASPCVRATPLAVLWQTRTKICPVVVPTLGTAWPSEEVDAQESQLAAITRVVGGRSRRQSS